VDPLGLKAGLREGFWADLFATHPPMAARIARLEGMAYQPSARP
jgi:Zn-dependent protease with chaperone function